ncbi:hypothetical protein [Agrobacterium tumefaciens]|uniref:hypothetical protein n=1 Tax=Agrobacterium tumefaciens TaxID=358 RepID=UPI001FFCA961|nr:hypothetical protein [Agrobacterium tumefaciens]
MHVVASDRAAAGDKYLELVNDMEMRVEFLVGIEVKPECLGVWCRDVGVFPNMLIFQDWPRRNLPGSFSV